MSYGSHGSTWAVGSGAEGMDSEARLSLEAGVEGKSLGQEHGTDYDIWPGMNDQGEGSSRATVETPVGTACGAVTAELKKACEERACFALGLGGDALY